MSRDAFTAGKWSVKLYPAVSVTLRLQRWAGDDQEGLTFSHEELRDLQYVVDRAISRAKIMLGPSYDHEV